MRYWVQAPAESLDGADYLHQECRDLDKAAGLQELGLLDVTGVCMRECGPVCKGRLKRGSEHVPLDAASPPDRWDTQTGQHGGGTGPVIAAARCTPRPPASRSRGPAND